MREAVFNNLQITIPDGWDDASTIVLVGPAREDFTPNITIARDEVNGSTTAQQYANEQRAELEAEFESSGYHVLKEGPASVAGEPAYQRRHTFTLPDTDVHVQQLQTYVVKGGIALTITATDRAEHFEHTKPLFMRVLQQVKFV